MNTIASKMYTSTSDSYTIELTLLKLYFSNHKEYRLS